MIKEKEHFEIKMYYLQKKLSLPITVPILKDEKPKQISLKNSSKQIPMLKSFQNSTRFAPIINLEIQKRIESAKCRAIAFGNAQHGWFNSIQESFQSPLRQGLSSYGIGNHDENAHKDGNDDERPLAPFGTFLFHLNCIQTVTLEFACTVHLVMMVVMMMCIFFCHFLVLYFV